MNLAEHFKTAVWSCGAATCITLLVSQAAAQTKPSEALVKRTEQSVRPAIAKALPDALKQSEQKQAIGHRVSAMFKAPIRVAAMDDPWSGMKALEDLGARAARAQTIPSLLHVLEGARKTTFTMDDAPSVLPQPDGPEAFFTYVTNQFSLAHRSYEEATRKLTAENRRFMMTWTPTLAANFGPQLPVNPKTQPLLQNDRAFCAFYDLHTNHRLLHQTMEQLAALTDHDFVSRWAAALTTRQTATPPPGMEGDILLAEKTALGWIVIGGRGVNRYHPPEPVVLLIDLGGDDLYRGMVACSRDAAHPFGLVIDCNGADVYRPDAYGLATGRAGIGILCDWQGDDTYHLAPGCGGVGLGGIGVLEDRAGNDRYLGTRLTQGAAIAGMGLLLDHAGDDHYQSEIFGIGLGGPAGIAAVIDRDGDDHYQCGEKIPSAYNNAEVNAAGTDDPRYQWQAFGLGTGIGRRVLSQNPQDQAFSLAGGTGLLLDLAGNDTSRSSNFSQGCGYFFGTGYRYDQAGDDQHGAARYGFAAGAHFGMGLFIDAQGRDTYRSTGPTYNGGCAWDHSCFLFLDAGVEGDDYQLGSSSGLGRADIGGWAVAVEAGGDDVYDVPSGQGLVSKESLAVFFDLGGTDTYPAEENRNGSSARQETGSLFRDLDE